jgi:hypothetical protein
VVAAMTAAGHAIGEPGDPGILNVAGMDASLPRVVTGFIRQANRAGRRAVRRYPSAWEPGG